jgi:hypothetical protein
MVRFQARWINKSYKGKDHCYRICSVNFHAKLHDKVKAKRKKDFEKWGPIRIIIDWIYEKPDFLPIDTLTRFENIFKAINNALA